MANTFHIPPEQNFLSELTAGIAHRFTDLSHITVVLPSKIASQELKTYFLSTNSPTILSMAELDEVTQLQHLPITSPMEYKMLLAQALIKLGCDNHLEAMSIAGKLSQIIAMFEKDNIPLEEIDKIEVGDAPEHIARLVKYLKLVIKDDELSSRISPFAKANLVISKLIKVWKPQGTIIVAYNACETKATALLLEFVATIKNGFVVLQGTGNSPWNNSTPLPQQAQIRFLNESMKLSDSAWHTLNAKDFDGLGNIAYIECKSIYEEALIIALRIKESTGRVGVITNNDRLVKCLDALATKFGFKLANLAGTPIASTPHMDFLRAIVDAVQHNFAPIQLLSLFKHPNCIPKPELLAALEINYLKGVRQYQTLEELITITSMKHQDVSVYLADLLSNTLPLITQLTHPQINFAKALTTLLDVSCKLGNTDLWQDQIGTKVFSYMQSLIQTWHAFPEIPAKDFTALIYGCTANKHIQTPLQDDGISVQVLNPVESRLLSFDSVILAGLNESSWPERVETFSWLTSHISELSGLSNPQAKVAESSYDFWCLAHHQNVLITRSETTDGEPQTPSRLVTRLMLVAKQIGQSESFKPSNPPLLLKARYFYMPDSFCTSTLPPPKPPIALRPRTLSATQVEMLMRDPYSVYAKHILNLKKLESIDKLPNQLEFGNLVHNIASLSSQGLDHKSLMKHIHTELRHMNMLPMVARIWMPRLERLAAWLIEFEQQRHSNNTKVYSEIKGSMQLPIDGEMFTITARADRLEVDNGSTTIIDFKTGVLPTKSDIEQGLSVQLLIEGLIARKQGFGIKTPTDIKLAYVQLGIGNKLGRIVELDLDIASALDKLEQDLIALLSKYSKEDSAYPACPDASIAPTYNEYEHLERYL